MCNNIIITHKQTIHPPLGGSIQHHLSHERSDTHAKLAADEVNVPHLHGGQSRLSALVPHPLQRTPPVVLLIFSNRLLSFMFNFYVIIFCLLRCFVSIFYFIFFVLIFRDVWFRSDLFQCLQKVVWVQGWCGGGGGVVGPLRLSLR